MPILSLDEAKTWLRVDKDDEDETIQMLIGAAESYLRNATGIEFDDQNQLAKLFCVVLVTDWYENRTLAGEGPSEKVRFTIQSMTAQLQNAYSQTEV